MMQYFQNTQRIKLYCLNDLNIFFIFLIYYNTKNGKKLKKSFYKS